MSIQDKLLDMVSLRSLVSVSEKKKNPEQAMLQELGRIVTWSVPVKPISAIPSFVPKVVPALTN